MKRASQRTGPLAMTATCVVSLVGAGLLGAAPGDSINDASISGGSPIGLAGTGCPLPACVIEFDDSCPDPAEECGAIFAGGECVFEFLKFCYNTGKFSYRVDPGAGASISLLGDVIALDVFFANVTGSTGEMRFFNADKKQIGEPLQTNGNCLLFMPDVQSRVFEEAVRFIEVSATGGQVYIDSFSINPGFAPPLGDLDGDCVVGVPDLLALLAVWGPCAECTDCPADLNDDCNVGVPDLLILLANWG